MLKKMLVGSFLLIMAGALVVGGISLFSRSQSAHAWQGRGQEDRGVIAQRASNQIVPGSQGHGQGRGQGGREASTNTETSENTPGSGYGLGQGQGNSQRSRTKPQVEVADWRTVEGVVVETTELVIETVDGQTVQVGLGPSHYRESQGFVLQVGDRVRVSGYSEDGEFKAGQVEKLDTGESIVLRDTDGRPMWAGWGRRNG